jgi:hypothetical protein
MGEVPSSPADRKGDNPAMTELPTYLLTSGKRSIPDHERLARYGSSADYLQEPEMDPVMDEFMRIRWLSHPDAKECFPHEPEMAPDEPTVERPSTGFLIVVLVLASVGFVGMIVGYFMLWG